MQLEKLKQKGMRSEQEDLKTNYNIYTDFLDVNKVFEKK